MAEKNVHLVHLLHRVFSCFIIVIIQCSIQNSFDLIAGVLLLRGEITSSWLGKCMTSSDSLHMWLHVDEILKYRLCV